MPRALSSSWFVILLAALSARAAEEPAKPAARPAEPPPAPASLAVEPAALTIRGADDTARLLVSGAAASVPGRTLDYTRFAKYVSSDPAVVEVSSAGVLVPRGDGTAQITVSFAGKAATAVVTVKDFGADPAVSFRNQVIPIFTKHGCNSGGCHGKATGQNGFRLSLLGFDAEFDHNALVKEARGRRVFPSAPDRSLLLTKAVGAIPHGGGRKIERDSPEYSVLLRWIRQGMPAGSDKDPAVVRIEVAPKERVVGRFSQQQMRVTAHYSDGAVRDVTAEAQYKSNDENIAQVDPDGLVRTDAATGDTAVMARYMGQVEVCRITIPLGTTAEQAVAAIPVKTYIDRLVQAKWRRLGLTPSPLADDAAFLRRAYLDAIGTLPTPEEVREFLDDKAPDKRDKWVDRILARNEYADHWAVKWGDILRNKRGGLREHVRGTFAFHAWIRNALATNMPYDTFVRNIIAAQGTVDQHPPVIWYRTVRNLTHQTNDTAQLFLGMRINCAQCHHHPYEKWSQDDYYGFQAFFARMGRKSGEIAQEPAIFVKPDGVVRHPVTGKVMSPRGLDGPEVAVGEDDDPRHKLVDWMVQPDNPFFARALANRLWAHFMGRGLVEPLDDMRVTNPPSNPELLDAMAAEFVKSGFDMKKLIRTIMVSSSYQLSSEPLPGNEDDQQNYARCYPKRLPAEVLLDAVSHVTGTVENFGGLPKGTRAIQLPDEGVGNYFLDVFGRPTRETACECERPREANLAQVLLTLNGAELQGKIGSGAGRIARLIKETKPDAAIVEELYFAAFCRPPRAGELRTVLDYVGAAKDKKAAYEDVLWAMLNTKEFLFSR